MEQFVSTPDATNKTLFGTVFFALGIIARRAFFAALKVVKTTKIWLQSKHVFCRDNDDPAGIVLTGLQYVCFNALFALVIILIVLVGD
jgi:hypothetical protein